MYKKISLVFIFFWLAVWSYAQTKTLNTGIRYFEFISDVPNTTNLNEYSRRDSWYNTLDYYFYNKFMNIHGYVGFPSLYTSVDVSEQLKNKEPVYQKEVNKFDRSTFVGVTVAPAITIDGLYPLVLNFSVGLSAITYVYQLFFFDNDTIDIREEEERYYYPLNRVNYGLGVEGTAMFTYFFSKHWGISTGLQGSFYWIFNSLKFPENTIVDITDESALDDRNATSYGVSLGVAYQF